MKQLLQSLKSGKTYVADVPVPTTRPGAVLVRTGASLVSAGTERMVVDFAQKSLVGKARSRPDLVRQVLEKARREGVLSALDAAFNRLDQPMPLGYSSAGTVMRVGKGVQAVRAGDRVACAGGGWAVHAEYAEVPQNLVTLLPDNVPFEHAAFATLGAIALHGFRLAGAQLGENVAVIGLGLLGQLAAGIAGAAGCRVFGIDLDPARVDLAKRLGAEAVARDQAEKAALTFTRDRGFDAVLICADTSSDDPVNLAGEIARDRATVVAVGAVGLNIPRRSYFAKELTILNSRSYGPGRYDPSYEEKGQDYPIGYVRWTEGRNLEAFVDLLATKRLNVVPLISHRFPIENAPQAYELITGEQDEHFLGVLLTYSEADRASTGQKIHVPGRETVSETLSETVQLGVIGAGNFAMAVMLPAVKKLDDIHMVGVASARGLNAQHAAGKFGFQYSTGDADQVLSDPNVNTIAVLTRHDSHALQVLAALEAGKHVFCEKPLALNARELAQIEDKLVECPNQLLVVGYNRRFAPLSVSLASFLGRRREPMHISFRVNAGYLPLEHWLHDPEQGGGRIIGEGCHFVDYLAYLTGSPPVNVTAHGLPDDGRYREDNVQLTFTFPDGSIGTVSYLANGDKSAGKERVEIFCGSRIAVLEDFRSLETVHEGRRYVQKSRLRQDKGHSAIWAAFAESIRRGGPPPIPYTDLFAVSRATFAAVRALRTGLTVEISSLTSDEVD